MKDLIFFTDRYPYNTSEAFIENEITTMAANYNRVFILPCGLMVNTDTCREVPSNVYVLTPPCRDDIYQSKPSISKKTIWGIKHLYFWMMMCFLSPLFYKELYYLIFQFGFNFPRFIRIIRTLAPSLRNKWHYRKRLKQYELGDVECYSYWLEPTVLFSDDIVGVHVNKKISRTHRWDLYVEESPIGYLPFQRQIISSINHLYVISKDGLDYLSKMYPEFKNKMSISRLGTKDYGLNKEGKRNIFRIVSCSNMIQVKRVDMIIDALSKIKNISTQVHWVHFGAGQLFNKLKAEAASKLNNIDYSFMGQVSNKEVVSYYENNHVDLFVNVSESEGIPVSIMEAISFGIPVVATDVGGTSEIVVDGYNGLLMNKNFNVEELTTIFLDAITGRINISSFREGARKVWEERYSCEKNYNEFYKNLN